MTACAILLMPASSVAPISPTETVKALQGSGDLRSFSHFGSSRKENRTHHRYLNWVFKNKWKSLTIRYVLCVV